MKRFLGVFLLTGAAALMMGAAVDPASFAWRKEVVIPAASPAPAAWSIPVDDELYRHTREGFSDLRIADAAGNQVPYAVCLTGSETTPVYEPVPGKIVAFRRIAAENAAEIDYELAEPKDSVGRLELSSPADRNFEKQVRLTFDDGGAAEEFAFFNHARNLDFRSGRWDFAPRRARRITIRIAPFAETRAEARQVLHEGRQDTFTESALTTGELVLDRIAFSAVRERTVPVAEYDRVPLAELSRTSGKGVTKVVLDVGWRRLRALCLKTSTKHWFRPVEIRVFCREEVGDRTTSGFFTILDVMFDSAERERNRSEISGALRVERVEVEIRNGDDPELADLTFEGEFTRETLLIDAAAVAPGPLTILYGNRELSMPEYDIRRQLDGFYGRPWTVLAASPEIANAADPALRGWRPVLRRAVPWIIAAAALVMAVLAWRMYRRIAPEGE